MRGVLACGGHPVVTALTVAGNPGMVERCCGPRNRSVAVVAVIAAGDVRRVLAGCCHPVVVAGAAVAHHRGVLDGGHHVPTPRIVAIGTFAAGRDVIQGLRGCHYGARVRVTAGARGIRQREVAADMASFAGNVDMSSVQNKAGAEMVEPGFRSNRAGNQQRKHRKGNAQLTQTARKPGAQKAAGASTRCHRGVIGTILHFDVRCGVHVLPEPGDVSIAKRQHFPVSQLRRQRTAEFGFPRLS